MHAVVAGTLISLIATIRLRPAVLDNYRINAAGWIIPAAVVTGLTGMFWFTRTERNGMRSSWPLHRCDALRRCFRVVPGAAAFLK